MCIIMHNRLIFAVYYDATFWFVSLFVCSLYIKTFLYHGCIIGDALRIYWTGVQVCRKHRDAVTFWYSWKPYRKSGRPKPPAVSARLWCPRLHGIADHVTETARKSSASVSAATARQKDMVVVAGAKIKEGLGLSPTNATYNLQTWMIQPPPKK